MTILIGYLYIDPNDVNEFVEDMRSISTATKKENGCLFYGVLVEDHRAGKILLAERWQNQECLDDHLKNQSAIDFKRQWGHRIKLDIKMYDGINERTI